ncbi:MAG: phosphoglycerate kinase [Gammaproteobacteria bacterium]|nr:phosphoglycerate kinase [Gammaproteobacteria bacterium]
MKVLAMDDVALDSRRVLLRTDLNVPFAGDAISDDSRIQAALPTVRQLIAANAAVLLLSHRGRPTEGEIDPTLSLRPVAEYLSTHLDCPVRFAQEWIDGVGVAPGEVVVLENVRFLTGEKADDDALGRRLAALCDVYVMDAFGTAHRAQASTHSVIRHAPVACAGPLLLSELEAIESALSQPARPLMAIVGGSKVSTKLRLLNRLLGVVDQLIVGGGIANNFLAAAGYPVGRSLLEPDLIETARALLERAGREGRTIPLPTDVVCASSIEDAAGAVTKPVDEVTDSEMILDIGPETAECYARLIEQAGTVVWNGPVGVFEVEAFAGGTQRLAQAIASAPGYSLAGGGDTLAAVSKYGVAEQISYVSTGGGAFLELLQGETLPAVSALASRAAMP